MHAHAIPEPRRPRDDDDSQELYVRCQQIERAERLRERAVRRAAKVAWLRRRLGL